MTLSYAECVIICIENMIGDFIIEQISTIKNQFPNFICLDDAIKQQVITNFMNVVNNKSWQIDDTFCTIKDCNIIQKYLDEEGIHIVFHNTLVTIALKVNMYDMCKKVLLKKALVMNGEIKTFDSIDLLVYIALLNNFWLFIGCNPFDDAVNVLKENNICMTKQKTYEPNGYVIAIHALA